MMYVFSFSKYIYAFLYKLGKYASKSLLFILAPDIFYRKLPFFLLNSFLWFTCY